MVSRAVPGLKRATSHCVGTPRAKGRQRLWSIAAPLQRALLPGFPPPDPARPWNAGRGRGIKVP